VRGRFLLSIIGLFFASEYLCAQQVTSRVNSVGEIKREGTKFRSTTTLQQNAAGDGGGGMGVQQGFGQVE
jgi:hypothetical protein